MNHGLRNFLVFSIVISLLLIGSSNAFIVYLRPPKMVIRMNVTEGQYSTGNGVAEVKNLNNETLSVEFLPQGNLTGNVFFDGDSSFDLEPEEGRNVTFEVRLNQSGVYDETMLVEYSLGGEKTVNLQVDMRIIADKVIVEDQNNVLKYMVIGFIALIIIVIVLFVFLKGGRNNE